MKLKYINFALRLVELVLVVSIDDDNKNTRLWIERTKSYERKVR